MNFNRFALASILACLPALSPYAHAAKTAVVIENVHIFDGKSSVRAGAPANVLIVDKLIEAISTETLSPPTEASVTRIDGGGRTLMPGLIDAHWHTMLVGQTLIDAMTSEVGYTNLRAAQVAEATLMRGFTTVRDMGGPVQGLRRAIEEGHCRLRPATTVLCSNSAASATHTASRWG